MNNKMKTHSKILTIILVLLIPVMIICFDYFIHKHNFSLIMLSKHGDTEIIQEYLEAEGIKHLVIEEIDFIYTDNFRLSLYKKKQFEEIIKQYSIEYGISWLGNSSGFLENSISITSKNEQAYREIAESGMWYMDSIKNLNETSFTGFGTKVSIIDSGIDLSIIEISKNMILKESQSYLKNDESIIDTTGHGTMVSGIISTISPDAHLVMYKVTSEGEDASSIIVLEAIIDAVKNGSNAINISLGSFVDTNNRTGSVIIKAFQKAVDYSTKNNVLIFTSAGNISINLDDLNNSGIIYLPAMLKNVVTVNSVNKSNALASYSNYGSHISFSMPGGDYSGINDYEDKNQKVLVYFPNYLLENKNIYAKTLSASTSIATSMATGVYLLYLEKFEADGMSTREIMDIIVKNSDDLGVLGKDILYGYGKMAAPKGSEN